MDYLSEIWRAINDTEVNTVNALFKLVLSIILGLVIGFERKSKGQSAGDRTFALISMGATLAMLLSIYIPQEYMGLKNGDPGRIAAQVLTGIGFLGAGAIIQMKGSVRGLTTAAGIWMAATIGLAVGAGMYVVSIIATLLVLFILGTLDRYDHRVGIGGRTRAVNVTFNEILSDFGKLDEVLGHHDIVVQDRFVKYDYGTGVSVVSILVFSSRRTDFGKLFDEIRAAIPTTSAITLTTDVKI